MVTATQIPTDTLEYIQSHLWINSEPEPDKPSGLVRFIPFRAQRDYYFKRTNRNIVVKARRLGFSCIEMGIAFKDVMTVKYTQAALITHLDEVTKKLLRVVKGFYHNLPSPKPSLGLDSAHGISIPSLGSSYQVGTAGGRIGFGRAISVHKLHMTEYAHYAPEKIAELKSGVEGTVFPEGVITKESTPKGAFGDFYDEYQAAKNGQSEYKAFFYGWYWDDRYYLNPGYEPHKQFIFPEDLEHLVYTDEEQEFLSRYSKILTDGNEIPLDWRIYWRRWKQRKDDFKQEFPENDVDCFLAAGGNVFPNEPLDRLFVYARDPLPLPDWAKAIEGTNHLKVWKDARPDGIYALACDIASGMRHGDESAAVIMDTHLEHVATLRGRWPPDVFAGKCMELITHYNKGMLSFERNPVVGRHGESFLATVLAKGYPNLYKAPDGKYGWWTGGALDKEGNRVGSRDFMIDEFRKVLNSGDFLTNDKDAIQQLRNMYYDEARGGRAETPKGKHDDIAFALLQVIQVVEKARKRRTGILAPIRIGLWR